MNSIITVHHLNDAAVAVLHGPQFHGVELERELLRAKRMLERWPAEMRGARWNGNRERRWYGQVLS
jgi:hypothetical protein